MPAARIERASCALQARAWTTIARPAKGWLQRAESNRPASAYEAGLVPDLPAVKQMRAAGLAPATTPL